jgi:HEAT repeat protein
VEPLIGALPDRDARVRRDAVQSLGLIKDKQAVEPLVTLLKSDIPPLVRERTITALAAIGQPAVEPLIAALQDKDPRVRRDAVRSLGLIKDVRAVEPLIAGLKDEDADCRGEAMKALVAIGEPAVNPLILALLAHAAADPGTASDPQGWLRGTHMLAPVPPGARIERLPDRDGRSAALAAIGEPAVKPLIAAVLRDKKTGSLESLFATLVAIGGPAVNPLIAALKSIDAGVQALAVAALYEIKDSRAEYANKYMAPDWNIREMAERYVFYLQAGQADTEWLLVLALCRYGDKAMATDFLNSDNFLLFQGGKAWARKNAFQIKTLPTVRGGDRWWGKNSSP